MRRGESCGKRSYVTLCRVGIVLLAGLTVIPILYLADVVILTLLDHHGFGMPYWLYEYRPMEGSRCDAISSALGSFIGFVQASTVRPIGILAASVMLPILTRGASRKHFRLAMTLSTLSLVADLIVLVSALTPGPLHWYFS